MVTDYNQTNQKNIVQTSKLILGKGEWILSSSQKTTKKSTDKNDNWLCNFT